MCLFAYVYNCVGISGFLAYKGILVILRLRSSLVIWRVRVIRNFIGKVFFITSE